MSAEVGLFVIFMCVLLEGFFSGSEIALVSADKVTIRALRKQGTLTGDRLGRFLDDPEGILATTLIGTNLAVVTSTTVFALLLREHWGKENEFLTVAILSPVLLLFGELIPKSAFRLHATRIAQVVVHPLAVLSTLLRPLIIVVRALTRQLEALVGRDAHATGGVTREELRLLLEHRESEEIEPVERDMIDRIFEFGEVTVKEVMRPLIDVVAVERGDALQEAVDKLRESGYSRLPVFAERIDDIVGVLWAMDLLFLENLDGEAGDIARPVHYVPENQKVTELLTDRRLKRSGLAVVVDEYGGAQGLVTIEDILEEIVGEIEDEHDDPEDDIQQRGEREFRVSARIEVDRLNEALGLEIPEGAGRYETLAGFLLHRFGRIPRIGEVAEVRGAVLTIAGCTSRAIDEVDIVVLDALESSRSEADPSPGHS
jgi:CBS domain containing-hemolysin-like protein